MKDVVCFIQARTNSTRLPGKIWLPIQGETLLDRAYRQASQIFGERATVVVGVVTDERLVEWIGQRETQPNAFAWAGDENDVLSRFWHAAKELKLAPDTLIARWTPDDWRKDTEYVRDAVRGLYWPVEKSVEVFTVEQLDEWYWSVLNDGREHIGHLLPPRPAPPDDGLPWSIDTQADYDAVIAAVGA